MLPIWCLLLAAATLCTVQTLRPSLWQRAACMLAAALAGLTAFAAPMPAAWLLPVLPAALWALTPTALVRRREDVSALVFRCAAAAFGHVLLLFCQTAF